MASTIRFSNPSDPNTQLTVAHVTLQLKARTVEDIVAFHPAQVSESWCRQTLNQLLQLLELQYSIGMPHGPINADTVVVTDEGETLLLSSWVGGNPEIADDINALGRLIHYAITQERFPMRPLRGRRLKGYSRPLLDAVDRCMAPVNEGRPQSFAEVRRLLQPVERRDAQILPRLLAPARTFAFSAAAIALAVVALAQFYSGPAGRLKTASSILSAPPAPRLSQGAVDSASERIRHLAQPATNDQSPKFESNQAAPPAVIDVAHIRADRQRSSSRSQAGAGGPRVGVDSVTKRSQRSVAPSSLPQRADAATVAPPPSTLADSTLAAAAGVELNLLIRPWGMVYVDGIAHGASPPVKRIAVTPGPHSILVTNPRAPDRRLVVDTGKSKSGLTVSIDFNHDP